MQNTIIRTFIVCLIAAFCFCATWIKSSDLKNADQSVLLPILYQQRAAEYKALCYQCYNLASLRVDQALSSKPKNKKYAIITDLDETSLDNSIFNARMYKADSSITLALLGQWWLSKGARTVPGSAEFFNYAAGKGIDIYYISGRSANPAVIKATRENMAALGFPFTGEADTAHFLFQQGASSSKESRRQSVRSRVDSVILLLGDNLIDLDQAFDGAGMNDRNMKADQLRALWGARYIVLPNAYYGDWESCLYNDFKAMNGGKVSRDQKDSIRVSQLLTN